MSITSNHALKSQADCNAKGDSPTSYQQVSSPSAPLVFNYHILSSSHPHIHLLRSRHCILSKDNYGTGCLTFSSLIAEDPLNSNDTSSLPLKCPFNLPYFGQHWTCCCHSMHHIAVCKMSMQLPITFVIFGCRADFFFFFFKSRLACGLDHGEIP